MERALSVFGQDLCATRRSWRWTRVAAGTHGSLRSHLTHECHSCSAATGPGVADGHVVVRNAGRNLASRVRTVSTYGWKKEPASPRLHTWA